MNIRVNSIEPENIVKKTKKKQENIVHTTQSGGGAFELSHVSFIFFSTN